MMMKQMKLRVVSVNKNLFRDDLSGEEKRSNTYSLQDSLGATDGPSVTLYLTDVQFEYDIGDVLLLNLEPVKE